MDDVDLAQDKQEMFRMQALRTHFTKQIDEPRYDNEGKRICLRCGTRILQAQLKALPDALRCLECQEKLERRSL
jgi:DnaK suppressor protein